MSGKRNRPRKPKPVQITTVEEYNQAVSRLKTHLDISGRFDLLEDLRRMVDYTARIVVTTKALLDMVEELELEKGEGGQHCKGNGKKGG